MDYQFQKHYTRDEAQALLPQVRIWLEQLDQSRRDLEKYDERLRGLLATGNDVGGGTSNHWVRVMADLQDVLRHFQLREIQIKDIERGLVDFPAIIAGREVFLCWEKDEETVEFWHDIDSGYAGRERL